jgi:hypothetical protein
MILSFTTYFDINQRKFRIQDTTNYAGQGININNVKGILKLTSPRGVVYNTQTYITPDVTPATSLYSPWIPLPQNQAGFIMAGAYSVQYSVQDVTTISTQINNYTYSFIIPQVVITQTPDGYNSTFESRDDTVYGSFTSLLRTHTVIPPSGSPLSTTSNSNQTIDYSPNIWSGEWASTITSVLVYTMGDGLIINCTITDTETITAFNVDMNVIRGYIEVLRLRYFTALDKDRDEAYRLKDRLLLIGASYSEYDLAIYYNDLATAYNKAVDIIIQLNDVITIIFPEEVIPFSSHGAGTPHNPVTINPNYAYGTTINVNQVLSFGLASILSGGMLKQLSGNVTDYMAGDGNWHVAGLGNVLKTDFTAFDAVRAITTTNITDWQSAFGLVGNVYTKTNLQTSGQALVHFNNLTNKPTTLTGYGITDGVVSNGSITGATHTKITYDTKGLVIAGDDLSDSDIPSLPWSKITSGIPTTLVGYGITDAYTKTQVDAKTWNWTTNIIGKPTTLSGYGIIDGLSISSPAEGVINTGLGDQFLADDGNYKYAKLHNTSDKQVVFINGATTEGSNNFIYDKYTNTLYTQNQIAGIVQIFDEIDFIGASGSGSGSGFRHWGDVKIYRTSNDLVLKDHHYTKTLSQLVSGATNFWTLSGSNIYYGTGTNRVGINQSIPTAELDVVGHIQANDFDSNFFRYKNSNLLIGPNAGDLEFGNNLLYIANSNTATPLIYGDFLNQELIFNSDVYINTIKRLAFGSSDVYIHRTSGDDLEFRDPNANGGLPITLSQLTTLTGYALKSDFTSYASVTTITAANKTTWNKAYILNTSGPSTNFLGEDGLYHAGGSGGVTPTDGIFKFDLGSVLYRPYIDKTEAGGVSSSGKMYGGTSNPSATTRLNYDGYFYGTKLYSGGNEVLTSSSFSTLSVQAFNNAIVGTTELDGGKDIFSSIDVDVYNPLSHILTYSWTGPGGFTSTNKTDLTTLTGLYTCIVTDTNNSRIYQTSTNVYAISSEANFGKPAGTFLPGKYTLTTDDSGVRSWIIAPIILKDFYTDASTSGTGETDLYSYSIPSNTLSSNGDKLSIYMVVDSSTTTGLINFYFAGTSINIGSLTALTGRTVIEAELIRTSSSTLRGSIKTLHVLNNYIFDLTSKDWTISNILKITGTASIGTFTAKFGYIEYKPAAI